MERITASDIPRAAGVIARAFFNDPLFAHFFPARATRLARLIALYTFRLKTQLADVFATSPALEGLAIWEGTCSHRPVLSPATLPPALAMAAGVGWAALVRMIRFQRWAERQRQAVIRPPYGYLDTLVVDPRHQGRGFAGRLVRPFLEQAITAGQPVYLETQNPCNLDIYAHFGFRIIARSRAPGAGVDHYCLRWEPSSSPSREFLSSIPA